MLNNTMTLEFKVVNQNLIRVDEQVIVEKSSDYLYIHFIFSEDWDGLLRYALFSPMDIDSPYKIEVSSSNTVKVPYDLVLFPGFIISMLGTDGTGGLRITTTAVGVDIEKAPIEDGTDTLAIRFVTSKNNTININKASDAVDLGFIPEFIFDSPTSIMTVNALTYNEYDEEGKPIEHRELLSQVQFNNTIRDVRAELSHKEGNEETTYRNLIFTFYDGSEQIISIDSFWDEIRQALANEISRANTSESQLRQAINEEATTRQTQDNALDIAIQQVATDLANYIASNNQALANEIARAQARENSIESTLTSRVNNLESNIQAGNIDLISQADFDAIFPPLED